MPARLRNAQCWFAGSMHPASLRTVSCLPSSFPPSKIVGGPAGIRTQTLPILSRLPLPVGVRGLTWWVPPDSNRDAPMEHSALQAGAANRIRLTPKTCGGESGNRTQSRASAWHVSSVLAYHLPHSPLAPGHGFEPRITALETVSLTIGNPGVKLGGKWRNRTPLIQHQPALFGSVWRPFTGTFPGAPGGRRNR